MTFVLHSGDFFSNTVSVSPQSDHQTPNQEMSDPFGHKEQKQLTQIPKSEMEKSTRMTSCHRPTTNKELFSAFIGRSGSK